MDFTLKKVVVIGAGTMGQGIATWFCQNGVQTSICDIRKDISDNSVKRTLQSWNKLLEKGKFTKDQVENFEKNLDSIDFSSIPEDVDLILEAVVENIDIKNKIFTELDNSLSENVIFASNTSSIPISSMAKVLSSKRQENFIGIHFFNPAPIMKLVEIIKGHRTNPKLANNLYNWFNSKDKKSALCKDSPGFIVNRVARNFYGESLHIVSNEKSEKFSEVDRVLKNVGGFKMGPFTLMDLIGIDINYDVTNSVWKSYYNHPRFSPHKIQRSMVDSGRLGKKSKEGFYKYE